MAIKLDKCQSRAHLHLAVIYHLDGKYNLAMFHYLRARQFNHHSTNRELIDDNIRKLLRFGLKQQHQHQQQQIIDNEQLQCGWEKQTTISSSSMMMINVHQSNIFTSIMTDNISQWNVMATEPPYITGKSSSSSSMNHNLLSLSSSSY